MNPQGQCSSSRGPLTGSSGASFFREHRADSLTVSMGCCKMRGPLPDAATACGLEGGQQARTRQGCFCCN
jgi:hypothetical protein